jgi:hypothetical protein
VGGLVVVMEQWEADSAVDAFRGESESGSERARWHPYTLGSGQDLDIGQLGDPS